MKFHFSIVGHAQSFNESKLKKFLNGVLSEANGIDNQKLDFWHVLVTKDNLE